MKKTIILTALALITFAILSIGISRFSLESIGAGTLGGFDIRLFSTSKKNIEKAIDSIYINYPEYKIPEKWKARDNWSQQGCDFLDSRIFYFQNEPEEMYYVTFIGDSNDVIQHDTNHTRIAIRAVDNGVSGWVLEKDFSSGEKERIEERFDLEIISRLKNYAKTQAIKED